MEIRIDRKWCAAYIKKGGEIVKSYGALARAVEAPGGYRLGDTSFPFPDAGFPGVAVKNGDGSLTVASVWLTGCAGSGTLEYAIRKHCRIAIEQVADDIICAPIANSGAKGVAVANIRDKKIIESILEMLSWNTKFKVIEK